MKGARIFWLAMRYYVRLHPYAWPSSAVGSPSSNNLPMNLVVAFVISIRMRDRGSGGIRHCGSGTFFARRTLGATKPSRTIKGHCRGFLHVVENLDRGAVENWLLRMLDHARKHGIESTGPFIASSREHGAMDDRARTLGARVIHSPVPIVKKLQFIRALRNELRRGRYDVVHCHHDLISAVYLMAAAGLPVHRRIAHVHNADESVLTPSPWKQCLYREPMRMVCLTLADRVVGISNHTLDTFLAGRHRRARARLCALLWRGFHAI